MTSGIQIGIPYRSAFTPKLRLGLKTTRSGVVRVRTFWPRIWVTWSISCGNADRWLLTWTTTVSALSSQSWVSWRSTSSQVAAEFVGKDGNSYARLLLWQEHQLTLVTGRSGSPRETDDGVTVTDENSRQQYFRRPPHTHAHAFARAHTYTHTTIVKPIICI